jgi:hypothetical protein
MATPATIERRIARLIQRFQLDRIELITNDGKRFTAIAYPVPWGAVVNARRAAAFTGKGDMTLAEATRISDKAASDALCRASAETVLLAIGALADALDRDTA